MKLFQLGIHLQKSIPQNSQSVLNDRERGYFLMGIHGHSAVRDSRLMGPMSIRKERDLICNQQIRYSHSTGRSYLADGLYILH